MTELAVSLTVLAGTILTLAVPLWRHKRQTDDIAGQVGHDDSGRTLMAMVTTLTVDMGALRAAVRRVEVEIVALTSDMQAVKSDVARLEDKVY